MMTLGDCIRSATPFQMGMLFESMQILVTYIKYQLLVNGTFDGYEVLCGNEKFEMPSSKDLTPQMLFKIPEDMNIAEQVFWASGLSGFHSFVEWWMAQPEPNNGYRDDDGIAWFDSYAVIEMWNTYLTIEASKEKEG